MVTVLAVLGVLLVLFVAGVAATRGDVELAEAPPDAADLDLPSGRLVADDVRRVRFGVTLRGYRMSEVDALLERLAAQLDEREVDERQLDERQLDERQLDERQLDERQLDERQELPERPEVPERQPAPVAAPPVARDDEA